MNGPAADPGQTPQTPPLPVSTVDLVYFNAGGGHRSSALALQHALRTQRGRTWQVRLVNLFEVLDPEGRFQRATGSLPEDFYNRRLARG